MATKFGIGQWDKPAPNKFSLAVRIIIILLAATNLCIIGMPEEMCNPVVCRYIGNSTMILAGALSAIEGMLGDTGGPIA